MAENPQIDLRSQLIGRGLDPNSPSTTYTDFADRIAKNRRDQLQAEQNLATAKETLAQSKISTRQKTDADAAGYNPELKGTMPKAAAKKYVETIIEAKKIKVEPKTIEAWYATLPPVVSTSEVKEFIDALTTGGASGRTFAGSAAEPDEDGILRMYNATRRNDGSLTTWYYNGSPVWPEEMEDAVTPEEKALAQKRRDGAVRSLHGMDTRFTTQRDTRDIKNWVDFAKSADITNNPAARAIGQAAVNNMRAERAMTLLNWEGDLTPQQYDIIVTDLAAIFKGGVPDIVSLAEQRYETLKGSIASKLQFWKSNPETISTPEIREILRKTTLEVKDVDNRIIGQHLATLTEGYKKYIDEDPERALRIINNQLRGMYPETVKGVSVRLLEIEDLKDIMSAIDRRIEEYVDMGTQQMLAEAGIGSGKKSATAKTRKPLSDFNK